MSVKEDFGVISERRGQFCFIDWKICDFLTRNASVNEIWQSPKFHLSGATWYIVLYPNGRTLDDEGCVSIYLRKEGSGISKHHSIVIVGIKSKDGSFYRCEPFSYAFEKEGFGISCLTSTEILKCDQSKISVEGAITFFLIVHIINTYNISTSSQTETFNDTSTLCRDFKQLLLSEESADVTIKVKDKELRAHSHILAARSSVLAPMLRHDMKEKNTGEVEILEFEPESFRDFLMFLYSGDVEKMSWDNVADLYGAAEKYNVEELKRRCLKFMTEEISADTFCYALSLGVKYNIQNLIDSCKEFFIVNSKTTTVASQWLSFAKEYPVQSNEILMKLLNQF